VLTKSAKSGIQVSGWTHSLGCVRSRLYQSRQKMHSSLKERGNDVFAQGIEQRGPLGKTLPRKMTTNLSDVSKWQCSQLPQGLYVFNTTMKDKR
jgi:hypothetical protein